MNITIFNKKYWLRRFGEQKNVRGYLTSPQEDMVVSIHVHPLGTDSISALPEGERKLKRLEGHGGIELFTANEQTGQKADLLYYHGDWYECLSCQLWDHTLLSHYNYQFVLVTRNAGRSTDIENEPTTDPGAEPGGEETGGEEP